MQDSGRVPKRSADNGARGQERGGLLRRHAAQALLRVSDGWRPARRAARRALHRHGPAQQALPLGHHTRQLSGNSYQLSAIDGVSVTEVNYPLTDNGSDSFYAINGVSHFLVSYWIIDGVGVTNLPAF